MKSSKIAQFYDAEKRRIFHGALLIAQLSVFRFIGAVFWYHTVSCAAGPFLHKRSWKPRITVIQNLGKTIIS